MKANLFPTVFLLAMAAPLSQAAVLSIGDPLPGLGDSNETITLQVADPFAITSLGAIAPGSGPFIDLGLASDPANNLTSIACSPAPCAPAAAGFPFFQEPAGSLSFEFANQIAWGSNVYFYRYWTEPDEIRLSDLFVIQGQGGTNPDFITFISSDTLTGDILVDGPAIRFPGAVPTALPTLNEGPGGWQLAFDTGVDQYYIASTPEPATLALLGLGLAGLGFSRRKK